MDDLANRRKSLQDALLDVPGPIPQDGLPLEFDFPFKFGGPNENLKAVPVAEDRSHEQVERAQQSDQLATIRSEYGFIPASNPELSMAWSIHQLRDQPASAAKFLNTVFLHQKKSTSERPNGALYVKVDEAVGYIVGSRNSLVTLSDIQDRLIRRSLEDEETEPLIDELSHESISLIGLRAVIRKKEVLQSIGDATDERLDLKFDINAKEAARRLSGMSYGELARHIAEAIAETENRLEFWSEALTGFKDHYAVRLYVIDKLKQLNLYQKNTPDQ